MIMATRKRHSPEQVVRKLTTADRLLAEGKDVAAVCRELGVSEQTYHRWRNQFGGLKADDAKRLKDLELAIRSSRPGTTWPPSTWPTCAASTPTSATPQAGGPPDAGIRPGRSARPAAVAQSPFG